MAHDARRVYEFRTCVRARRVNPRETEETVVCPVRVFVVRDHASALKEFTDTVWHIESLEHGYHQCADKCMVDMFHVPDMVCPIYENKERKSKEIGVFFDFARDLSSRFGDVPALKDRFGAMHVIDMSGECLTDDVVYPGQRLNAAVTQLDGVVSKVIGMGTSGGTVGAFAGTSTAPCVTVFVGIDDAVAEFLRDLYKGDGTHDIAQRIMVEVHGAFERHARFTSGWLTPQVCSWHRGMEFKNLCESARAMNVCVGDGWNSFRDIYISNAPALAGLDGFHYSVVTCGLFPSLDRHAVTAVFGIHVPEVEFTVLFSRCVPVDAASARLPCNRRAGFRFEMPAEVFFAHMEAGSCGGMNTDPCIGRGCEDEEDGFDDERMQSLASIMDGVTGMRVVPIFNVIGNTEYMNDSLEAFEAYTSLFADLEWGLGDVTAWSLDGLALATCTSPAAVRVVHGIQRALVGEGKLRVRVEPPAETYMSLPEDAGSERFRSKIVESMDAIKPYVTDRTRALIRTGMIRRIDVAGQGGERGGATGSDSGDGDAVVVVDQNKLSFEEMTTLGYRDMWSESPLHICFQNDGSGGFSPWSFPAETKWEDAAGGNAKLARAYGVLKDTLAFRLGTVSRYIHANLVRKGQAGDARAQKRISACVRSYGIRKKRCSCLQRATVIFKPEFY